jgi:hypothetical protein
MEGFFAEILDLRTGLAECRHVPDRLEPMVYLICQPQSGVCPQANSSFGQLNSQADLG